jgi:putative sterol carrier protein
MATFLSDEHFAAAKDGLNSDGGFQNSITGVSLSVQFDVSGTPKGDISYYLNIADGSVDTAMGGMEGADVTVGSDFETSKDISKGELNVQMAFMSGKIKVGGNMAKVMMYQGLINEFARVSSTLDLDF